MMRMERGEGCSESSGTGLAGEVAQAQQDHTIQSLRLCKAPAPRPLHTTALQRQSLLPASQSGDQNCPDFGHKFIHNATNAPPPNSSLK